MAEATQSQILERIADPTLALAAVLIAAIVAPVAVLPILLIFSLAAWVIHRGGLLGLIKAPSILFVAALAVAIWITATIVWTIAPEATPPAAIALALAFLLGGGAAVLIARSAPPPPTHWAVWAVAFAAVLVMAFNAAAGWAFLTGGVFVAMLPILLFPIAAALRTRFGRGEAVLWSLVAIGLCVVGGGFGLLIAVVIGGFTFLMTGLSAIAGRILLTLLLLVLGVLIPVTTFLVGDAVISATRDILGHGNDVAALLQGWQDVIAAWSGTAILGLGAAAIPLSGGGGGFLRLLAETGWIGWAITIIALLVLIWRGVPRMESADATWRAQAIAGAIGTGLVLGTVQSDIWAPWWPGALVLSAMLASACRIQSPEKASLGSIFDLAKDDETTTAEDAPPQDEEWKVDPKAVADTDDAFDDEPDAWEIEDIEDDKKPADEEESFSFDRLDPGAEKKR